MWSLRLAAALTDNSPDSISRQSVASTGFKLPSKDLDRVDCTRLGKDCY
jgi:hypothetical protein